MHCMFLFVLTLAAVCHGNEGQVTEPVKLPTPKVYGWSTFESGSRTYHWLPVDEEEDQDPGDEPVLGYKVKMWEVGCVTKRKWVTVDGAARLVEQRGMPELLDSSTLGNLQEFTLEGVKNSDFFLQGYRKDVPYQITVASYGASGVGNFTTPNRFQEEGEYTCRDL